MKKIKMILLLALSLGLIGCESAKFKNYDFIESVTNSAKDPMVWGNAAGAVILTLGDFDQNISDSARKNAYFFGNEEDAAVWSDDLRAATRISMHVSSLVVEKDNQGLTWQTAGNKALRLATDSANAGLVTGAASDLQWMTDLDRPNGACCGFPSQHASRAFATANMTKRNYQASSLPDYVQNSVIAATYASAYMTAWARVEAGAHYPSQVLAGAAFGTFLSSIIHDLTEVYSSPFKVNLHVAPEEVGINFQIDFD